MIPQTIDNSIPVKPTTKQWSEIKTYLPPQFRTVVDTLDTEEEQILFVFSMIAACSAIPTGMHGIYGRRKTYGNVFFICQAPPASGKGLLESPRIAFGKIHETLLKETSSKLALYQEQKTAAQKAKAPQPGKTPFTLLFMPGNCTASRMIQHIKENGLNPIIILETEAGTLAAANKSQHGDFSDIVWRTFQGETISLTRKGNDEFIEVKEPKLAIVLSGTPDQISRLIGTPEDGSFSRYIFYSFLGQDEWRDMNCQDCLNLTDLLLSQQEEYYQFWRFFHDRQVVFKLTEHQWGEVNASFREEYDVAKLTGNVYAKGAVKRHGLILFKICMTLSALRAFSRKDKDSIIECEDKDFEIAKYLISVSLESSMEVLEQLPKPQLLAKTADKKSVLFDRMTERFSRSEAVALAKEMRASARTIDRWLERLVSSGRLIVPEHGWYEKAISTN